VSWVVTFTCVLLLGIQYGIIAGVVFDLILVVARNLRPSTHVHDMGDGVILVEVDSGWNFLSVNFVKEKVEEALYWERKKFFFSQSTTVNAIILDMSMFGELDITALESLKGLQDDCRSEKILLFSVGLSEELSTDAENFGIAIPNFDTSEEAVRAAKREVGLAIAIRERINRHGSKGDQKYGTFNGEESDDSQQLTMRTATAGTQVEEDAEGRVEEEGVEVEGREIMPDLSDVQSVDE
jgi:sodium-independent sulfate anion transporter 11